MYLWKLITIVVSFKNVQLLLVDEIIYTDEEIQSAIVTDLQMLELGIITLPGRLYGCDIFHDLLFYIECDFYLASRVCMVLGNYSLKQENIYIGYYEPSFKISDLGVPYKRYVDYLTCGEPGINDFDRNQNVIKVPGGLLMSKYDGPFKSYTHFSIYVVEKDLFMQRFYLVKYAILIMFIEIPLTKPKERINLNVKGFVNVLLSDIYMKMFSDTKCKFLYKGYNCWLDCTETLKKYCVCTIENNVEECEIFCKMGYAYRIVSYRYGDTRVLLKVCDLIDRCAYNLNLCTKTCLPSGNNTFYCEDVFVYWNSQFSPIDNISSPILYSTELIQLTIDTLAFTSDFRAHNFIIIVGVDLEDYDKLTYTFYEILTNSKIKITGYNKSEIEGVFKFIKIYVVFVYWDVVTRIQKKFYIFHPLLNAFIRRQEDNVIAEHDLALGENYSCNSSAFPDYAIVMTWSSDLINYTFPFNTSYILDQHTKPVTCTIQCRVDFIIHERPDMFLEVNIKVQIRPYYRFFWTVQSQIIHSDANVTCVAQAYVNFTLYIMSLDTVDDVDLDYHTLIIRNLSGGYYSFSCIMVFEFHHGLSRYLEFYLTHFPTEICWYLFPHTVGAISQCGHNGYFEDDYELVVKFFYPLADVHIENNRYIQIPYAAMEDEFMLHCSVLHVITKIIYLNLSLTAKFQSNVFSRYEEGKRCSSYPYIEYPAVQFIFENQTVIAHYLFYITLPFNLEYLFDILNVFVLFHCLLVLFLSSKIVYKYVIYEMRLRYSLHYSRLELIRNRIRDKLLKIVTDCVADKAIELRIKQMYYFTRSQDLTDKAEAYELD